MSNKSKKIKTIFIFYWFLLAYVIAALIWWYIALNTQNKKMAVLKIQQLNSQNDHYSQQQANIIDEQKRKTTQYIGEGAIFLLLISAGAIFLFNAVKNQLKISEQQQNFMMAITHELKTPIAISKLNLETLQKRKLDDTQQDRLILNTLEEANRMNSLCNNLLLSSQIEAGGYSLTQERLNISEILENCVKDFSKRFPQKIFSATIEKDVHVLGDIFLLQMAFNNLIDNSIKYSPKDTSIDIKLMNMADLCEINIIDFGAGIKNEEKNKVFNKFYRIGDENTRKSKGTGLGLYLVQRIIKAHQGKITIKDNQPSGSNFVIQLDLLS
jgi:K+-sensing histidine kinase KdpD